MAFQTRLRTQKRCFTACFWIAFNGFLFHQLSVVQAVHPLPLQVKDSEAKSADEMKPYTELVEHSRAKIPLLPIQGGRFLMGSAADESERNQDEGPQHQVSISPFWMGKYEITWDVYEVWMSDLDILRRSVTQKPANPRDELAAAYQISQPTEPYTDMSFGMGKKGYPAICMTQHAARVFCKWLSAKTGRYYRLPTEAEWEYACRAGTTSAYSFGDNSAELADHAWFDDNSTEGYHKVGKKKPNPWGLYDMHGNVSEWVLDQHAQDGYQRHTSTDPLISPTKLYPRVVRGGGWDDTAKYLRSAARFSSDEDWKSQDPQIPQSIWYHTDALSVGFRIVRPLEEPSKEEQATKWDLSLPLQRDEE